MLVRQIAMISLSGDFIFVISNDLCFRFLDVVLVTTSFVLLIHLTGIYLGPGLGVGESAKNEIFLTLVGLTILGLT